MEVQKFEVLIVVLLLLILFNVLVPTSVDRLSFLDKWFVLIYLNVIPIYIYVWLQYQMLVPYQEFNNLNMNFYILHD